MAAAHPPSESVYFTIYIDDKRIAVTDELLRGGWYFGDAQSKFNGGRSLYERAQKAASIQNDFPEIWHIIEKLRRETEIKPYDGHVVFTPNVKTHEERFKVTGQKAGRDLDEDKLCRDILDALKSGGQLSSRLKGGSHNIVAEVKPVQPRPEREILGKLGLRGGYTTYFDSAPAREHNIELALSALNGLVIPNGETASFNKVVGPRTSARGYQEAKIIIDGEFVPGVGGGVCQVSTTLFNAVLLAGLKIDKSYNHSLAISYVPIGRDAMVSSSADLRFTNNSGGTVYIEAGVRENSAFVRIYGNKTNVEYKVRTQVTESDLKPDEIDPARQSRTYIEAWSGDKLVHSKLVRKSNYRGRKKEQVTSSSEQGATGNRLGKPGQSGDGVTDHLFKRSCQDVI